MLVTGAGGFVGSAVVRRLVRGGGELWDGSAVERVVALLRPGRLSSTAPGAEARRSLGDRAGRRVRRRGSARSASAGASPRRRQYGAERGGVLRQGRWSCAARNAVRGAGGTRRRACRPCGQRLGARTRGRSRRERCRRSAVPVRAAQGRGGRAAPRPRRTERSRLDQPPPLQHLRALREAVALAPVPGFPPLAR